MNSPAIDTRGARAVAGLKSGAAETRLAWKLRLERDVDRPTRRRNRERPARNDQGIARSNADALLRRVCVCAEPPHCTASALLSFLPRRNWPERDTRVRSLSNDAPIARTFEALMLEMLQLKLQLYVRDPPTLSRLMSSSLSRS